ncbi:MAG: GNAT family N-acetyltransferase [Pseudomonadota bacterium]
MLPGPERLLAAVDATWPPAEMMERDGWVLRRGAGGGKRVSAASRLPGAEPDVTAAVAGLAAWAQPPLFRLDPGDGALDTELAADGYALIDPVVLYAASVATLTDDRDETARIIRVSTPVAVAAEIWAAGGIGPGRLAVMERAEGPRVTLIARRDDRPLGVAFCALDGPVAMIHAVEVLADHRRRGLGAELLTGVANWAAAEGAETLALAVTEANTGARALYERAGMVPAGHYHYRGR